MLYFFGTSWWTFQSHVEFSEIYSIVSSQHLLKVGAVSFEKKTSIHILGSWPHIHAGCAHNLGSWPQLQSGRLDCPISSLPNNNGTCDLIYQVASWSWMIWLNKDGWSDYKKLLIRIREVSDMYKLLLEGGWSNNFKQVIWMIFLKSNDPASGN